MIFVTVGNAEQPFDRLLQAVDKLLRAGAIQDVVMQAGNSDFRSSLCRVERFFFLEDFESLVRRSEHVICHGGAGTLIHVLRAGRRPIVMPRRKKYREVIDDHQFELTSVLETAGFVTVVHDVQQLESAIRSQVSAGAPVMATSPLVNMIASLIAEISQRATQSPRDVARPIAE